MSILFINAAFRENSRTKRLADYYLSLQTDDIVTLDLGQFDGQPLKAGSIKTYNQAVKTASYEDPMFDWGKQFREADEIVIAAPFWNFSIPAVLHDYLELVCSQGVTFDVDDKGVYFSLCKAKKLVYITTAGGLLPEVDHAYGYIADLARIFWDIPEVKYYKADGIDILGNDKEALLTEAQKQMKESW